MSELGLEGVHTPQWELLSPLPGLGGLWGVLRPVRLGP